MELTPQLLTDEIDFRIAVRGYDRHEVDDFLERVAVAVGQLQSQLTKAVTRARGAEAKLAELEAAGGTKTPSAKAKPTPTEVAEQGEKAAKVVAEKPASTEQPADAPAPAVTAPKAPPSAPVPVISTDAELNDELRRTLVLAQRTADLAIREAHEEARNIVQQADDEARRNREAAEAAHAAAREEARGRLVGEIRELEATRESMRADTVVLDRYLGTERARVRETIQVLRRLVDDPGSFQVGPTPELSDATVPVEDAEPSVEPEEETPVEEASEASVAADAQDPIESAPSADEGESDDAGQLAEPADEIPADASGISEEAEHVSASADDPTPAAGTPVVDGAGQEDLDPSTPQASEPSTPAVVDESPTDGEERPQSDSERLGQLFAPGGPSKDWRSSGSDRGDQGPHTQPVAAARFEEESDEAFLAELRRAMNEDEPLGPTDK